MKKVLGLIFSLVGNIGTAIIVLVTCGVIALGVLSETFNMAVACVLLAFNVVLFVIANIGNSIEDELQEGLKVKIILFRLLGWIPKLLGLIIGIAGAFVILAGVVGIFDSSLFEGIIPIASVENKALLMLGIAMLVGGCLWLNLYGTYILHHCKYCGCNLKGGDYGYEEIERTATFGNSDKVRLTSKIRFEFDCPECGETTVFYKNLRTDGEMVDNFARSIVGKD